MDGAFEPPKSQSRNSIEDIWGPRTPYKDEWPTRVDQALDAEPDNWVQSACVLCRYSNASQQHETAYLTYELVEAMDVHWI